jgi:hypothetical protein
MTEVVKDGQKVNLIQSRSRVLKLVVYGIGERRRKRKGQGMRPVLFYDTRCQRKIPDPNTSATRTLGAGKVTLM